MKKPKGIYIYLQHSDAIRKLSDVQKGKLLEALIDFGENGEYTDFSSDPVLDMIYTIITKDIALNFEHYSSICENRSKAASAREAAKKTAETLERKHPERPKRGRFRQKLIEHDDSDFLDAWNRMSPEYTCAE